MIDPTYIDGEYPWEDDTYSRKQPKWRLPRTELQRRLLQVFALKYWPLWSKSQRSRFVVVEKGIGPVGKVIPQYPLEWFNHCISWADRKRRSGQAVDLKGFFTLFYDDDAREKFRERLTKSVDSGFDEEFR